jgi:hypothetical protein
MLGVIVAAQGRLAEGERLVDQALATFKSRLGSEHREIAFALGNLAEIRRLQGATSEAGYLAEHAWAIGARTLGPSHPELAPILNTLALLRHQSGDTRGASQLLERAVVALDGTVAADLPARHVCAKNLARVRDHAMQSGAIPRNGSPPPHDAGERGATRTPPRH